MKTNVLTASLLSAVVGAAPQLGGGGNGATSNDIQNGQCGDVNFVMARGSTEQGNMGTIVGAPLCAAMQAMGNVACQGIGGNYQATIQANLQPQGTDQQSIAQAMSDIQNAMTACPSSTLVLGGYSQGTAVISQAVQSMPAAMQNQIAGVAFYGYTKNQQTGGMLPGYPQAQTFVACNNNDGVCGGNLQVTAGHLAYTNDGSIPQGAQFLMQAATNAGAPATQKQKRQDIGQLLSGLTGAGQGGGATGGTGGGAGDIAGLLSGLTGGGTGGQNGGGASGLAGLLSGLTGGGNGGNGATSTATGGTTTGTGTATGNGTPQTSGTASGGATNGTTTTTGNGAGNGATNGTVAAGNAANNTNNRRDVITSNSFRFLM